MKALESISKFAGNTFAFWTILFACLGFFVPGGFTWVLHYITIFLGVVMFGMGLTLRGKDFKEVFKRPKDVAIGVLAQYVIMPLVAFLLASILPVSKEVAVGIILVGSCPGGTASNVMTFISKGDTALSVAVTSVSTILAPIVTPALILLLASKWVAIAPAGLIISILKIVIVPIVLGVLVRMIFKGKVEASTKVLPLISVISIVLIVAAVVGASHDQLAKTGIEIFLAVMLHNCLGLLIGYWIAKLLKMDVNKRKAISIEVGMQNSALGATLAQLHFSPLAAVPSAIFSIWHNISGPIVATIYRRFKTEKNLEAKETSGNLKTT